MPVEVYAPDTYLKDKFSAKTAKWLMEKIGEHLNEIYIKAVEEKKGLEDKDLAMVMAQISEDMASKLRELKEIDRMTKFKEAIHWDAIVKKFKEVVA
jgi:hypothetical protein